MLRHGTYPLFLKQRVASDKGHLSNAQAAEALAKLAGPKTKHIILAHLSEKNNMPQLLCKKYLMLLLQMKARQIFPLPKKSSSSAYRSLSDKGNSCLGEVLPLKYRRLYHSDRKKNVILVLACLLVSASSFSLVIVLRHQMILNLLVRFLLALHQQWYLFKVLVPLKKKALLVSLLSAVAVD